MKPEEIIQLIATSFEEAIVEAFLDEQIPALHIALDRVHDVCELLHTSEGAYFDCLSCLTGIDNGSESNTMEVVYNLYSIPYDQHFVLKVKTDRAQPEVESVSDIWKTADWHERETYDMLGISFKNHPDLRRILMPDDWEGYPLRKDYQEQEIYHDIKVKY